MPISLSTRDFLFSIHPMYADLILSGKKTVELRRRFPSKITDCSKLVIYSTSPTSAIVGAVNIVGVNRLPVPELWRHFGDAACIAEVAFSNYFAGLTEGVAICLDRPQTFNQPVDAKVLKDKSGFTAPQSYMYMSNHVLSAINDAQADYTY